MSIKIMFRKCQHCKRKYPYNPSVGNFGLFCPKCKKAQTNQPRYTQISQRDNRLSF